MARLVLRPTLGDFSREEIEKFLEVVRAKRMAATVEYFATKNRKIELKQGAVGQRIEKQVEMLGKEIARLEEYEEKVAVRLNAIQELMNEHEQLGDSVVEVDDGRARGKRKVNV